MRSVSEILGDIKMNKAQYESCRDYFGAMWNCDVQASMFKVGSNKALDELRAELKKVVNANA